MIRLEVQRGPYVGRQISTEKSIVTIGRLALNELCLSNDIGVSGCHARLVFREGQWFIEDLGSKNGTFLEVDGVLKRVYQPVPISSGQSIVVGMSTLGVTFQVQPGVNPDAPTASRHPPIVKMRSGRGLGLRARINAATRRRHCLRAKRSR